MHAFEFPPVVSAYCFSHLLKSSIFCYYLILYFCFSFLDFLFFLFFFKKKESIYLFSIFILICRFSSDLYTIDDSLPFILNILLANFVGLLGIAVVLSYVQILGEKKKEKDFIYILRSCGFLIF